MTEEINTNMESKAPQYEIEEFKPEYTDQVKAVVHTVLYNLGIGKREGAAEISEQPNRDADLDEIPKIYNGRGRFWVVVRNGKVIGTVAIRDMGGKTAKLNRMFILTQYHGTGVGQGLLDHALNHAREQGFEEVILNTDQLMQRAHRFYERNGFIKTGVRENKSVDYKLELRK